jgi:hypothetical protein
MLVADCIRADDFELGANLESGAIGPSEVSRLPSLSGYIPPKLDGGKDAAPERSRITWFPDRILISCGVCLRPIFALL